VKQNVSYNNLDTIDIPRKFNDLNTHAKSLSVLNQEIENLLKYKAKEKTTNIHSIGMTTLTILVIVVIIYKIIKYIKNINKKTKNQTEDKLKVVYHVDKSKIQKDNIITVEEAN